MLSAKYRQNPGTASPLVTHFYCSPAKHLGGSFLSVFTRKQGERALSWNVTPSRENRILCALTTAQLWPQKDLLSPESAGKPAGFTLSFLEQGDLTSSVSHNRKQAVMVVQRSHMLCKVWKVLCHTQCLTLDSAPGSAELEVNVFWCSEFRESSWLWEVPPSYSVNFCTFSFLPLSRSGSKISEQSGGNMKNLATLVAFSIWQKLISFLFPSQISQWVLDTLYKATEGETAILHQIITSPVIPWDYHREGALEKTKTAIWWQEIPANQIK